jgi:Mce-associated membrane protein
VTSEARPREEQVVTSSSRAGEDVDRPRAGTGSTAAVVAPAVDDGPERDAVAVAVAENGAEPRRSRRARRGSRDGERSGSRLSLPLVPTLAVLLVLLLGGIAFLWLTRPESSAVRTGNYAEALQAARSGVVDLTSFDYLTLDDDIEQVRRVATGDLRDEAVAELDSNRDQITQAEAVVNTEVVGAGVTRADDSAATVLLVIQSTQESNAAEQAQVVRYRIEVELEKSDGRWLLSGIKGTGTDG